MSKSITTLALIGISALIILYILSSFHKVFNLQTKHTETATTQSEQLGELDDEVMTDSLVAQNDNEQLLLAEEETGSHSDDESNIRSDDESELRSEDEEEEEETEEEQDEKEIEFVGTPGDMLRERPHLQNALPPIPNAPPSSEGSPIVTSPSEESYSQTDSHSGSFPAPVTDAAPTNNNSTNRGSAFPAPVMPDSARNPSSNTQSSSNFPAPR